MQTNKTSAMLKADAREKLLGNYKTVIFAYAIIQFITSGCLSIVESQSDFNSLSASLIYALVNIIISLFLAIFTTGQNHMYLNLYRGEKIASRDIWYAFRLLADKCILIQLIIYAKIFICFIPSITVFAVMLFTNNYYLSLLLSACIIIGLIISVIILLSYSQVFYIILDNQELSAKDVLIKSKEIMQGHKARFFYLNVSFIGIMFLVLLTFGFGMFWAYPYMTATKTGFYLNITNQDIAPNTNQEIRPTINLTV